MTAKVLYQVKWKLFVNESRQSAWINRSHILRRDVYETETIISCRYGILENETVTEIIYDVMFSNRISCRHGILKNETVTEIIHDIMLFTFKNKIVYYV